MIFVEGGEEHTETYCKETRKAGVVYQVEDANFSWKYKLLGVEL